jgi:formylglycine-generating enzyme required for sulfatase activity
MGVVSLEAFLAARGVDTSAWSSLAEALAVSEDGRWVTGWGYYPASAATYDAFLVDLGPACPANMNIDSTVDGTDLAVLLAQWGSCNSCSSDLTGDGQVDGFDLSAMLGSWGPCSWGVTIPSWATLTEAHPDPAVVTDAALRAAIDDTGLAWRVRDSLTGIEMVLVPPGTFSMGCSASDVYSCDSDEVPVHQVTLTQPFYLSRTEVTQSQWTARMGSNPSSFQGSNYPNSGSRPVEKVGWIAVQDFLAVTGLRLPTEAEWEYAYRADTTTAFHGTTANPAGTNSDATLADIAWFGVNPGQTQPVAQKACNGLGLFDMSGNVWEWVNDWYAGNYYSTGPSVDPQGPSSGTERVTRGGTYYLSSRYCRSSERRQVLPTYVSSSQGFRVARNP